MTSNVGILKIGIADNPLIRLRSVKAQWPIITTLHKCWGLSRHEAAFLERMIHRRLVPFRLEKELFRVPTADACEEVDRVIRSLNFTPVSFTSPPLNPVRKSKNATKSTIVSIRLDRKTKEWAEGCADSEDRPLSSWLARLIDRERTQRSRKRVREPVTAGSSR